MSWEEFISMYERNVDPVGNKYSMEPFQFFLIVQFLMFDKDLVGTISVDETMDMLYRRYGKDKFEAQMRKLFGDDVTRDTNKTLTFPDYLKAVIQPPRRILGRSRTKEEQ